MKRVKITKDINELHEKYFDLKLILSKSLNLLYFYNHKYTFYITCLLIIIFTLILDIFYNKKNILSKSFKKYIKDCKKLILYNRNKIYNKIPYISVCISILNIENFIERNLLSIINQSFQDFEIIIVNDASNNEIENTIKKIQLNEDRIKLISHSKKLGIYRSRIESIINSKGKYILLLDSKDLYLNENLFKELYNYIMKYNLDIIGFSVFQQIEGNSKIFCLDNEFLVHFNNFNHNNIIYQPEISDILFNLSSSNKNGRIIFKSIYNKILRRSLFTKIVNYIGKEYYHEYIISTDDMLMNILSYQYAINYSNIKLSGYLFIQRKVTKSKFDKFDNTKRKVIAMNHILYLKLLLKYIKDYNKNINYLFYEIKDLHQYILEIKDNKMTESISNLKKLFYKIMKKNDISNEFRSYLNNIINYFQN